jgi:2-keto-4-pentenoate hydratase/2-oxohepta-3-ene-1,7-dioic acid hydratase in catechol pathway
MTSYVFEPSQRPSLPVQGSGLRFPMRRVYCIGRNYAAHTIGMGTPSGVAAVARGDVMEAGIAGVGALRVAMA